MEEIWMNFSLFYILQMSYNECMYFYNENMISLYFWKVNQLYKILKDVPRQQTITIESQLIQGETCW